MALLTNGAKNLLQSNPRRNVVRRAGGNTAALREKSHTIYTSDYFDLKLRLYCSTSSQL